MDASQSGEILIVTLVDGETQRSLMLNKELKVTARLPQPCAARTDGTLVFDDRQGHLLTGQLLDLRELREQVQK